jgi:hypothetical protein
METIQETCTHENYSWEDMDVYDPFAGARGIENGPYKTMTLAVCDDCGAVATDTEYDQEYDADDYGRYTTYAYPVWE